MHVVISYPDGSNEHVTVHLSMMDAQGGFTLPGHGVGKTSGRSAVDTDYLCRALDDMGERSGVWEAMDEEDQTVTWRLVGTERDHCMEELRAWAELLGPEPFRDPCFASRDADGVLAVAEAAGLARHRRTEFTDAVSVLFHYVDDLPALVDEALAEPPSLRP